MPARVYGQAGEWIRKLLTKLFMSMYFVNQVLPPYVLKRSARSRHIRLSVSAGGRVSVTAPIRVSMLVIRSFLESKMEWLREKVEYFKKISESKISLVEEKKLFVRHKITALERAEEKVKRWNEYYGFAFGKISIRNSHTRWGSCSAKGTICFNYKIAFLPEYLADYLVVHELCHLKERNHGKGFWSLVERTIPDYAMIRRELRDFKPKI